MHYRMLIITCSLASSLALGSGVVTTSALQYLQHTGQVVDMDTRDPISVDAKAWPESKPTGEEGGCPLFGKSPLDSTKSDISKAGTFEFTIDASKRTYTATYCANGYITRVDRDIPNRKDKDPVMPYPVEMIKRGKSPKDYEPHIIYRTINLLNDLSYLRSIDPKRFERTMSTLAEEVGESSRPRGKLINTFAGIVEGWSQ